MNLSNSQESVTRIADYLGQVRKRGVRLWLEGGQLRFRAPKGELTQEELERLRASRVQIAAHLESAAGVETSTPRLSVPVSFSQLSHWYLYRLHERRSMRQIASATRLQGRLNIGALKESAAEMVRRHEALRTRIVVCDGSLTQEIVESDGCELVVDDLTTLPESSRKTEVKRLIEQFILKPIDVAADPLFGIRLFKLCDDEHVLIVAMEHMISDAFSMNVLLRDLLTAYVQASKGRAFSLPEISVQFSDYSAWQNSTHRSWIEKHGAYWNERLAGCQRVRFPSDIDAPAMTNLGWGIAPLHIGGDLKGELLEWCRLTRTTLVMSVLTAYVGLVLRWCNVADAVIQYVTDGRTNRKIENTIGYFASVLYLRMELTEDDSFVDLMHRIREEYCKASEHADAAYMESRVPRPEFARNSCFNWVPQGVKADISELDSLEGAITCSPVTFEHPIIKNLERDTEPFVLLYEADDEITGGVYFPRNRFSSDTMERFGRNFLVFIKALLQQPQTRVKDVLLV